MSRYEVIREIPNHCANNRMRDVDIEEIDTVDPVAWVRARTGPDAELSVSEEGMSGATIVARSGGLVVRYIFTEI